MADLDAALVQKVLDVELSEGFEPVSPKAG